MINQNSILKRQSTASYQKRIGIFSFIILFALSIQTNAAEQNEKQVARFVPSSMQLYYGQNPKIIATLKKRMKTGQLVVIETRGLDRKTITEITTLADDIGAKVVGYISIGELDGIDVKRFIAFAKKKKSPQNAEQGITPLDIVTFGKNPHFNSRYADVSKKLWKAWIFSEADRIEAAGLEGLFLDTVDTADLYITKKRMVAQTT